MLDLPQAYQEDIEVDPTQQKIQLALPTFKLETVHEEEHQLPLQYSLQMRDGSQVPDFIFISVLPDGERVIELDSAELPPGHGAVFEVALSVFDPNSEATQLIPISVKCPAPTTGLQLVSLNFESPVDYQVGSKPTIIKVPTY